MENVEPKTIEELKDIVNEVFLIADDGVVEALCATVITNRLRGDAVWMMLVSPSSGGKSELIQALDGLKFIHPISDLTVNTFASGFKTKEGESSLLWKANKGIFTFKDFTSILSKNKDAKKEIMGQLREIYDGKYTKRTGNQNDTNWTGKIGAIAGSTEMVYEALADLSAMGDRFIMYNMDQPPRLEVARRVLSNAHDIKEKRKKIMDAFSYYINYALEKGGKEDITLSNEIKEELLEVADFATQVRSAVITDFKTGAVDFVPSAEMPMRVAAQLYNIATGFVILNRARPLAMQDPNALTDSQKRILYKFAMDSIPKKRRIALQVIAKYDTGISSGLVATKLNYPTGTVTKWFSQLNGLGIVERVKQSGGFGDKWIMRAQYRKVMIKFDHIETEEVATNSEENSIDLIEDRDGDFGESEL